MPTRCVRRLAPRILLEDVSVEEANEFIRKKTAEQYDLSPGHVIRGVGILGKGPMLIGIKRKQKKVLFPFTRPCFGTQLIEIDATDEEIENIKRELGGE